MSFTILTTMSRKFGVMKLSLRNCRPDVLLMREVAGGGLPSLESAKRRLDFRDLREHCRQSIRRRGHRRHGHRDAHHVGRQFGDRGSRPRLSAGMWLTTTGPACSRESKRDIGSACGSPPACSWRWQRCCGFFAPQLVEIFRSDPAVVAVGVAALHIQCCTVILNGFNMMGNMMTQTMGRTGIASFLALCRQGLFLAPIVLVLPLAFGVLGVEMAQSVSDVLTIAVTIPFMRRILRELS